LDKIIDAGEDEAVFVFRGVEVTRLDIGEEFPIFNNARIRPADTIGRMRVEVDCDYSDQITLGIDTQILLNWPKPKIAVLPISLVLSVVKFSATNIDNGATK